MYIIIVEVEFVVALKTRKVNNDVPGHDELPGIARN